MKRICLIVCISVVFSGCASNGTTGKKSSVAGVKVELRVDYSDVDLYYSMIDKARADGKKIDALYLYENYIRKGSEGLQFTYDHLVDAVEKYGDGTQDAMQIYWEEFQPNMKFLETNREVFIKNRSLFTRERIAPIREKLASFLETDLTSTFYFYIGGGRMGGTAFNKGVVIDISMVKTDDIDYSDFWLPSFVDSFQRAGLDITFLIIHELMHQLQDTYRIYDNLSKEDVESSTVGDLLLVEGGAHFFANLMLGEDAKSANYIIHNHQYYQENPQIMNEVLAAKDLDQSNATKWFFNYGATREGEPPDMGYYLGYVICQDYYERAKDKRKAFNDIVRYWANRDIILDSYINNTLEPVQ